ncbi:hypothetical protein [Yoonia sp.]|uniref:hypothetical protein n=1 Tax=Yoonia sp. TaxID=2212373 RepID=UPI00391B46C2
MKRCLPALAACLVVAGCAAPNPPTITSRDNANALTEATRISRLPQTQISDLPTGSVTYNGKVGANVGGDLQGSMLGDMSMNVGFNTNTVRGSVTNLNLINQAGRPDQALGGNLAINGFEDRGNLSAGAGGTITGVAPGGSAFSSDVNLNLQGNLRDDRHRGDAVFGTVAGQALGDVNLGFDGVFFGKR